MKPILTIVGPTAVGKTGIAIELAQRISGEIVSADSRQIYKYLDIGTAKPTRFEQQMVSFHLIDIVQPDEHYSCAQFARDAEMKIDKIMQQGRVPIVCGGAGLYIKALYEPLHDLPESTVSVKDKYVRLLKKHGLEHLYEKLKICDPQWAEKISPKDTQRILRGLEVYDMTGVSISRFMKKDKKKARYAPQFVGLKIARKALYRKINDRFDRMIEQGLIEEVKVLLERGFKPGAPGFRTIGYKEIIGYLKGRYPLDQAISKAKQRTRNFARRQIIWFRKTPGIEWFDSGDSHVIDHLSEYRKEVKS